MIPFYALTHIKSSHFLFARNTAISLRFNVFFCKFIYNMIGDEPHFFYFISKYSAGKTEIF